jgi:RNA polymerase sigma-70 factor, ECF subfamily
MYMEQVEVFTQYRPLLFSIAYRMMGSAMDAEDLVQESYLRWQATDRGTVESPKAFLTTIMTRLCIDQWRSARMQREEYIGPWLPEPILSSRFEDPTKMSDSISIAFLTLLESLSPIERAVYLLREVFDYEYAEIARIVDKSEANCRQMVKRAKDHLVAARPRFAVQPGEHERLLMEFSQACATGDMNGLLAILAEDVVGLSDGGGKVTAARNPIYGADKVARFMLGLMNKLPEGLVVQAQVINGQPAVVSYVNNQPYSILTIEVGAGRIQQVYNVLNPEKLKGIPALEE